MKSMNRLIKLASVVTTAALCLFSAAGWSAITPIQLADFSNPNVLDFESASTGNVAADDQIFADVGLSSVSATASNFSDIYESRADSSRALWANASGLVVADPGAGAFDGLAESVSYIFELRKPHTKFGIGIHDQAETFFLEFFIGAASAGSIYFQTLSADLNQAYFSNSRPFNSVRISNGGRAGFAVDNITLEPVNVPEPSAFALFALGLAAIGYQWRKRAS